MTGKRKRYSADFKAKVAMEALRGELTAWPCLVKCPRFEVRVRQEDADDDAVEVHAGSVC